jgi:DNA uptake protein ComE-like DNA-binding protein
MRMATRVALATAAGASLAMSGCMSCSVNQNPEQLKERTAQTTAALKRDARAVASGVREGWSRERPLDLNRATRSQLASLPGITSTQAGRIVQNRPYDRPDELVQRRILTKQEFDKIADRVTAKK